MRFRIGPLELLDANGHPVTLGGRRERVPRSLPPNIDTSLRVHRFRLVLNSFGSTGAFGLTCSHEAPSGVVDRALPVSTLTTARPVSEVGDWSGLRQQS